MRTSEIHCRTSYNILYWNVWTYWTSASQFKICVRYVTNYLDSALSSCCDGNILCAFITSPLSTTALSSSPVPYDSSIQHAFPSAIKRNTKLNTNDVTINLNSSFIVFLTCSL
eukprot:685418_1